MCDINQNSENDELSLKDLKHQARQFRSFFLAVTRFAIQSFKRFYLVFFILLVAAMALGYYQYISQKSFTATSSYVYNELTKKTYGEMIDKLQEMVLSSSYHQLAAELQLPLQRAEKIVGIQATNLYGSKLSEDITERNKSFYITVEATDKTLFDKLQPVLESYLNNNLLAAQMVKRKVYKMEQRLAYLQAEQAMLDSLKMAYTKSLEKSSSSVSANANPFNPVELFDKSGKINQEIVDINGMLRDQRAVITADKFVVKEHTFEKTLPSFLLKYFLLFVAAGILFLVCIFIFKK